MHLKVVSTGLFRTVLNSKTCSHYPQPSSLNTQQAPLQHGNEFNFILQLPTISYFLGSHTVLLKPRVFWRIPTVSFISSVALPLLVLLSAAQPPIFSSLHFSSLSLLPFLPRFPHSCCLCDMCRYPAVRVESSSRQNPDLPPLLPRVSACVPRPAH